MLGASPAADAATAEPAIVSRAARIRALSATSFIDRIRVGLTALVLVHHTAVAFGSEGGWYLRAPGAVPGSAPLLTVLCSVDQAFFMGFFFLLAGYFTPTSMARKGTRRYLVDRFVRLGIPLALYAVVLGPFTIALATGARGARLLPAWWAVLHEYGLDVGPLWFVEALLIFSIGYAAYRAVAGTAAEERDAGLPSHASLAVAAVATGLAAFLIRLWIPTGRTVLEMQLGYFASYVVLFVVGCMASRRRWLERVDASYARPWIRVTRITVPVLFVYAIVAGAPSGRPFPLNGGWNMPAFVYAMWEPFVAWGIILTILWRARAAKRPSPVWQTLAPLAYTTYIIHPPILVAFTLAAVAAGMPNPVAFVAVAEATVVTTFTVAGLVVHLPGAARVL